MFLSLGSADRELHQPNPGLGAGQVHFEAWGIFPWGRLPGWAHACIFMLPSSRVEAPSSIKNASQAFEVATVALSFKADFQRNKCCQLDPVLSTLCYMKQGWSERDVWGCPDYIFFFFSACSLRHQLRSCLSWMTEWQTWKCSGSVNSQE